MKYRSLIIQFGNKHVYSITKIFFELLGYLDRIVRDYSLEIRDTLFTMDLESDLPIIGSAIVLKEPADQEEAQVVSTVSEWLKDQVKRTAPVTLVELMLTMFKENKHLQQYLVRKSPQIKALLDKIVELNK